jgi:hypothetical protein
LVFIALLARPLFTGSKCDLDFIHVKVIDGNETDTLSLVVSGTTRNTNMDFFVNGALVDQKTVNPDDIIEIKGEFGDVGEDVDVEIITELNQTIYKHTLTIQPS